MKDERKFVKMIGSNIKKIRMAKSWTQKDLAENSSLNKITIGNYERDERTPNIDAVISIANALGVSIDRLVNNKTYNLKRDEEKENLNKNTVTKQQIEKIFIDSDKKVERYWDKCTVLTIQLPNGFTIVEHSACVDPANYNEDIGYDICKEKVINKLWELEGYKLQCELGKL